MQVGQIVAGKYRLLGQIGEGGMGSVWSAVHQLLDRTVAIKFLRFCGADAAAVSERFAREAQSAARVSHRYVVDVFDFGVTEEGVHYMVQELLHGESLAHCMNQGPAWDVRDLLRFVGRCLAGLDAVHTAGIVHRDMKPENIYVARDTEGPFPKLLDFGICHVRRAHVSEPPPPGAAPASATRAAQKSRNKAKARSARKHVAAITEGTPAYMAPEQLRGLPDLDGRADLYSVGVILYEWLTGRLPYEQTDPAELCAHIAARSAVPLFTLRPDLGQELSDIVARALAPEPAERFSSAAELRAELLALVPGMPDVLSVVQRESIAPIGTKTERILSVASSPFADVDDVQTASHPVLVLESPWRARLPTVAAAAAFLLLGGWGLTRLAAMGDSARPAVALAAPVAPVTRAPVPAAPAAPALAAPEVEAEPEPVDEAPPAVAQAALVAPSEPEPAPAPALKPRKPSVAAAKAKLVRAAQRAAGVKATPEPLASAESAPVAPRGEPLREVRLEMAVQSPAPPEGVVEERQLTGLDLRRLGL